MLNVDESANLYRTSTCDLMAEKRSFKMTRVTSLANCQRAF